MPRTPVTPSSAASSPSSLTILTGASRGLGLAIAQALLQPGHLLLCLSRHRSDALAVQAERCGAGLEQWQVDLAEPRAASDRLAPWLAAHHEVRQATLINNAGVLADMAPLGEADPDALSRGLRVGLEAPMLLTDAFLAATSTWRATRSVLNISSGLGRRAMASQAAYCAAKAGMDHFTRCVALEQAERGRLGLPAARVCSIAPGVVDTDMQAQLRSADRSRFPDQPAFAALHAGGQLTSPEEAARKVLAWLSRPDFGQQAVADVREA